MRSKGVSRGIATTLGFFDDSEGTACTLVTAGVPVSLIVGFRLVRFFFLKLRFIQLIYFQIRKSALSTLECIHRAGILHGDIRHDNILIGDSEITIIDFSHSEESANQKAEDRELSHLRYLLGLAKKE